MEEGYRGESFALVVDDVVKDYPRPSRGARSFFLPSWRQGKIRALDGVSFGVRPGSVFGLLGTNGAGKTTLIKIVYGLLYPTSGSARVLGMDPLRQGRVARSRMGMVLSEERSFYWRLSGRRNLEFFAALHGMDPSSAARRIDELAGILDMREYLDVPFSDYSAGMRQKAAVARALLHDPQVLLMDEPTRSLSPDAAYPLQDFIRGELVAARDKTVLLATQDMGEAERLCDEAAILHRGRLLFLGSLEGLLRRGEALLGRGAGLGDIFVELVRREGAMPGGGAGEEERSGKEAGG
ncbi:MAG: ABC transporter ATP-binding protein [Actinomycetota bacterium]|nr:ABC transporter ATP-binding protein [Actinomycetota bacterium]